MKRKKYWLWPFVGIAFLALGTWAVMLLWNHVITEVIPAVKQVTYWQALGILALCKILFGHGGPRGGWKKGGPQRGGSHWRQKYRNMSEEEKNKMREEWKKRCEKWNE